LKNYPAIKESRARAQAAEEGVAVARTAYLPRLDMLWQETWPCRIAAISAPKFVSSRRGDGSLARTPARRY
jgi:hypothetical protein